MNLNHLDWTDCIFIILSDIIEKSKLIQLPRKQVLLVISSPNEENPYKCLKDTCTTLIGWMYLPTYFPLRDEYEGIKCYLLVN